jgi:hypothetical protein
MKNGFDKIRSLRVIDIARTVSVFDFVILLLIILIPTAILAKASPRKGGGGRKSEPNVKITSIDPVSGPVGTTITIYGVGFTDNNSVKIKGKTLASGLSSLDGTTLVFTLPPDTPCKPPKACPLKVLVSNQQGESNAYPFKVTHGSVIQDLVIVTEALPGGTEGVYYETTLQAEGGTTPYSWRVSAGSLPIGLEIGSTTGIISGIPSAGGTSTFTAEVQDANGTSVSREFSITIEAAPLVLDKITIRGRFVDYFTKDPIAGVDIKKTSMSQDAVIQSSNENGEFSIITTVSELTTEITGSSKAFYYYPSCYYYAQSIAVRRYEDNSIGVLSHIFDLRPNFTSTNRGIIVTSPEVDLGDVTIWPATGIQMYFDKELKIMIRYPEEGSAYGHANYVMDTEGYLGGNIIPFDYPLTVELEDRDGNVYSPPTYSHPREAGCSSTVILNFFNGEFNWSSQ